MNIYNYSKCGNCIHQEVCQYKEQQKDVLEKMNTRLDNSCAPSIFKFSFECQQYQPAETVKNIFI